MNDKKKRIATQLLFDTNETAKLLGRSPYSTRMLYYQGKLSAVRDGRKLYFHIDAIQAFIEKHTEKRDN